MGKLVSVSVIALVIFFLVHNLIFFNSRSGYIYALHVKYAQIVSQEWRLPTIEETAKFYDPPLFFLVSGLFTRAASFFSGKEFFEAVIYWRYFSLIFSVGSFYLWYQIIKKLLPQNRAAQVMFLVGLFSLPVLHKTLVMYTIEPWLWFITSVTLWHFIFKVLPRPSLKNVLLLSLLMAAALLSRVSALSVFLAIAAVFLIRKKWLYLTLFVGLTFAGTWWFYGRPSDLYEDRITIVMNRFKSGVPVQERLKFLTDVPFHFMMTHPIRMEVWLNRFIPIYYSEFWGDFWNYYIQRRFGIDFEAREADKLLTTPKRVANLALQNQVNLPTTTLMIFGFIYLVYRVVWRRRHRDETWLIEAMLLIVFVVTWAGFLYSITFHGSDKGDSIKASYMLFILPIFIYQTVLFLFNVVKKIKYIFVPVMIWLALATAINLWWGWY